MSIKRTRTVLIIVHFVKYYLYTCRNRRKLPTVTGLTYEFTGLERTMGRNDTWNTNFRECVNNFGEIFI
jgi:hypothetical protein